MEKILSHSWPGNVRELRNAIRRAVLLTKGNIMERINISNEVGRHVHSPGDKNDPAGELDFENATKKAERDVIRKAIEDAEGNKSKAAKLLNMNERTFYRKLKSLGIN
jgi:DNA-binding NtrC family response regulator